MTRLPDFLEHLDRDVIGMSSAEQSHCNALFRHKQLSVSSHALWWPSSSDSKSTILVFIPGNPGLVDFYTPFLTAIHDKSSRTLPILARAHVGHTPGVDESYTMKNPWSIGLTAQVESLIEVLDAVKSRFARVVVVAHSVGSWLTLQALRARPGSIDSVFLLFPTVAHIGNTPNGRKLSWLFRWPLPRLVSHASVFTRAIPLRLLSRIFSDWPLSQMLVLRMLLNSPSVIYATLTMAHDEMTTIKDIDASVLQAHRHLIHLYFAEEDDWVGDQKEVVLKAFEQDEGNVRIVHGHRDIPHAFCINHGEELAKQCYGWLLDGGFA